MHFNPAKTKSIGGPFQSTLNCHSQALRKAWFKEGYTAGKGNLSKGNGNENVTWKYYFILFVLLRDYFNSSIVYINGGLSTNQIRVKKVNEKFTAVRSRSAQNLEFGHFTLLFCRGRHRNVSKFKTHVQSDCFSSLNLLLCGVVAVVAVGVA